jgi:hypothetical protein
MVSPRTIFTKCLVLPRRPFLELLDRLEVGRSPRDSAMDHITCFSTSRRSVVLESLPSGPVVPGLGRQPRQARAAVGVGR